MTISINDLLRYHIIVSQSTTEDGLSVLSSKYNIDISQEVISYKPLVYVLTSGDSQYLLALDFLEGPINRDSLLDYDEQGRLTNYKGTYQASKEIDRGHYKAIDLTKTYSRALVKNDLLLSLILASKKTPTTCLDPLLDVVWRMPDRRIADYLYTILSVHPGYYGEVPVGFFVPGFNKTGTRDSPDTFADYMPQSFFAVSGKQVYSDGLVSVLRDDTTSYYLVNEGSDQVAIGVDIDQEYYSRLSLDITTLKSYQSTTNVVIAFRATLAAFALASELNGVEVIEVSPSGDYVPSARIPHTAILYKEEAYCIRNVAYRLGYFNSITSRSKVVWLHGRIGKIDRTNYSTIPLEDTITICRDKLMLLNDSLDSA